MNKKSFYFPLILLLTIMVFLFSNSTQAQAQTQCDLLGGDSDLDEICDDIDNCIDMAKPGQEDFDEDEIGDECDEDIDDDGVLNIDDECRCRSEYPLWSIRSPDGGTPGFRKPGWQIGI